MKRILTIIVSALFIAFMAVSCSDNEKKDEGNKNSNATEDTQKWTSPEPDDKKDDKKTEAPKTEAKSSMITRSDIDKVNNFIVNGKCDEAVKIIKSWNGKKPSEGINVLTDIIHEGQCVKEVADALNELLEARKNAAK